MTRVRSILTHFKMDKFNLQWNDFMSTVSKSFAQLRKEEDFYDVTLVSDDEEHISAHKVVLAASSGFFKNILKKATHANPLLYINGVKSKELKFILDYIYNGKVEMYQEDIDDFINAAQKLRVEGLDIKDEDPCVDETIEVINDDAPQPQTTVEKETKTVDKKKAESMKSSIIALNKPGEISSGLNELYTKNGDLFACIKCGRTARKSSDIRRHVEMHIEGLSYECPLNCGQTFRSRSQLKDHKRKCN